jgi:glycosyl hydrolase family 12
VITGVVVAAVLLSVGAVAAVRHLGGGNGARGAATAAGSAIGGTGRADVVTATPAFTPPKLAVVPKKAPLASHRPAPTPVRHPRASAPASASASPAAPPPSAASGSCTHPLFVTSDPTNGWTNGAYYLSNDMWNISGYSVTQTLHACSDSNWYVVANMNNDRGDGAVKTYPDVHEDFSEPRISSFHSISSTFAETSPHVGIYEDAYDIWINGVATSGSTEVMIWTENFGQVPGGSPQGSATFGGRTYKVWKNGNYIAFVPDHNFTAGSMDLLEFFNWVIAKGWMPATSTLGQIDYGAEIVSTNSAPATFRFTNFSISTS